MDILDNEKPENFCSLQQKQTGVILKDIVRFATLKIVNWTN